MTDNIRPEVVALLGRIDLEATAAGADNRGMAFLGALAGHGDLITKDGRPFTVFERKLLSTCTREELEAVRTRLAAEMDQHSAHLADHNRLHQLIEPYQQPGDETIGDTLERMPVELQDEADAILRRLYEATR